MQLPLAASVALWAGATAALLWVSREALRRPGSHGFYRFFGWQCIVLLVLLARWGVPQTASPVQVLVLGALPLLAMGLFVAATLLRLRQLDELMRKLEVESWALAALLVSQGYFVAWVLMRLGLIRIDAGNALLWLGVWLMLVQVVVYTWQLRKYL